MMEVKAIDVVHKFAPKAAPDYVEAFRSGDELLEEYGVATPLRLSHFMAQAMHETGFRTLRESGRYTAKNLARMWDKGSWHKYFKDRDHCLSYAVKTKEDEEALFNLVYSNRLGNGPPESGDGWKYRGGGLLQTTGRRAYARYGEIFGIDLINNPDLIYAAEHALKPALREWREGNLNVAADQDDTEVITKTINGSLKSVNERRANFRKIWHYVSVQEPIEESREWKVQEALQALGYKEVRPDGIVGVRTRTAISLFRKSAGLAPGLNIDAELLEALYLDELAALERVESLPSATLGDPASPDVTKLPLLIKAGSTAEGLAKARATAMARLEAYPKNGCAAHLSALLNQAEIDVHPTSGANKLVGRLKMRGWRRVEVGNQAPGDVGVTYDKDPVPPGPDHVYLVTENIDGNRMLIADNQNPKDAPHERPASGGGKTKTEYFLRA